MGLPNNASWLLHLTVLAGVAFSLPGAIAQAGPAPLQAAFPMTFDTVSIHPSRQDDLRPEHIDNPPKRGYLRAINVNLKSLMEIAYDLPDLRMFGGPTWLTTEKFSVEAKTDSKVDEELAALPNDQAKQAKRKMVAALLIARFKLNVHSDTKVMPVYAMVVAKNGPKLDARQHGGDPQSPGSEIINIRAGSNTLQVLAYELSWRIGRPVLDQTGVQDNEAITLRWRDDEGAPDELNAPSLPTALEEQLGLKLKPTKDSVPILLIDHAEKPNEN